MRYLCSFLLLFLVWSPFLVAQDKADPKVDKALIDSLRIVHDRGGDLYNAGDHAAGYRMYQGGLLVAKGLLGHRPSLVRMIDEGMAAADKQSTVAKRAFQLHELIEKVRTELQSTEPAPLPELPSKKVGEPMKPIDPKEPEKENPKEAPKEAPKENPKEAPKEKTPTGEVLTVPPRDVTPKRNDNPPAKIGEIESGVVGRVIIGGKAAQGVDVTFHSLKENKRYTGTSGPEGVFTISNLPLGMYKITLKPTDQSKVKIGPAYEKVDTTTLRFELEKPGEKFDVILE